MNYIDNHSHLETKEGNIKSEPESEDFIIGDRACVRSYHFMRPGSIGVVTAVDELGFVTLRFADEQEFTYECDDLTKVKPKKNNININGSANDSIIVSGDNNIVK